MFHMLLHRVDRLGLAFEQVRCNVPSADVDEGQDVFFTMETEDLDRSTQISREYMVLGVVAGADETGLGVCLFAESV